MDSPKLSDLTNVNLLCLHCGKDKQCEHCLVKKELPEKLLCEDCKITSIDSLINLKETSIIPPERK
jgi:hypothetical protein